MIAVPSMRCAQGVGLRLALPALGPSASGPSMAVQRMGLRQAFSQLSPATARQGGRRALAVQPLTRSGNGAARGYSSASAHGGASARGAQTSLKAVASGSLIAALALSAYRQSSQSSAIECEDLASRSYKNLPSLEEATGQKEPESIVDFYQLGFGTVCGLCAGIFIKKGLKLIAFLLGGTYVLMQYFSSQRWISIDWKAIGSKYEKVIDTASGGPADPAGNPITNSRLARIWQRLVHFLTADFQQRATFTAGLVLGFRLG